MKKINITKKIVAAFVTGFVVLVFGCLVSSSALAADLIASCSVSPGSVSLNQTVTFTLAVSGGTGSYTYSWSGACSGSTTGCTTSFTTPGTKTATASVISGSSSASASCSVEVIPDPVTTDLKVNNSDGPITVAYQNRNAVNLTWTSSNASSCTATSTDDIWLGSKSVTGSQIISLPTVKAYTLTLTCTNSTSGSSVSDSVQVTLQAPTAPTVVTKGVVVTY